MAEEFVVALIKPLRSNLCSLRGLHFKSSRPVIPYTLNIRTFTHTIHLPKNKIWMSFALEAYKSQRRVRLLCRENTVDHDPPLCRPCSARSDPKFVSLSREKKYQEQSCLNGVWRKLTYSSSLEPSFCTRLPFGN